ncbi:DUF6499 domain-containing protein [Phenylobacterium sp.]|uniref:transcriptional regulator domain-containing protein n=1 Tax=Phenylobacterium sp. TaxID=1871053 RepID=UPI003421CF28
MSSKPNWRDPAAYHQAAQLPVADLAWEFLRRDIGYRRAYASAVRHTPEAADMIAQRWGLRFRRGPTPGRRRCRSLLASEP